MLFPEKKTLEELDVKNSKVDDILPAKGLSVWNSRGWHPGKKEYIRFFDPYYKNVDYINGYSTLLRDRKTIKNINKEYYV